MATEAIATLGAKFIIRDVVTAKTVATTFAESTKTLTRAVGSWVTDGVKVGHTLRTASATNPGPFTVVTVTALVVTVSEAVADEAEASIVINIDAVLGEVISIDGPSGDRPVNDATHLLSTRREKRPGIADSGQIQMEANFIPGNIGQQTFIGDLATATVRTFIVDFGDADAHTLEMDGFAKTFNPSGQLDDRWTASMSVEITGKWDLKKAGVLVA